MTTVKRPIIAIDVDGVLNPDVSSKQRSRLWYHHGWRRSAVDLPIGRTLLIINPEHGIWLQKLADDVDAELVWVSRWNELANEHVAPLAGLPALPFVKTPSHERESEPPRLKAPSLVEWAAGWPIVWFDDQQREFTGVSQLVPVSQPFLGVLTNAKVGLTIGDISQAREWLSTLV